MMGLEWYQTMRGINPDTFKSKKWQRTEDSSLGEGHDIAPIIHKISPTAD